LYGLYKSSAEEEMAQGTVELAVILPDSLVREAEASGLLIPPPLETWLREELRRRRDGFAQASRNNQRWLSLRTHW